MSSKIWLLLLLGFVVNFFYVDAIRKTEACELDKMENGCRIYNGQCSCGFGCKAEYRYPNLDKCEQALSGNPYTGCSNEFTCCLHGGTYLQRISWPGYECSCAGTGFFGHRCESPCPGPKNPHFRGPFPYECIIIK